MGREGRSEEERALLVREVSFWARRSWGVGGGTGGDAVGKNVRRYRVKNPLDEVMSELARTVAGPGNEITKRRRRCRS